MTTWKSVERAIAKLIGGRRIPVTGRNRGETPDIEHHLFSIEVKHRKEIPEWLKDAMNQAKAAHKNYQYPMVVLHEKGQKFEESLTILELKDIIWLKDEIESLRKQIPKKPEPYVYVCKHLPTDFDYICAMCGNLVKKLEAK